MAISANNSESTGVAASSKFGMFTDLKTPKDITAYTLYRGTTDFTQLRQFDMYESGYPYLVLVSIPTFLEKMAEADQNVQLIVNDYKHIIENEFLGFDSGLTNIEAETGEITNGIQSMNLITKVNAPSASTFSATYREKAGAPITKMHELYLRCIRDPATTFKTYNGMIGFGSDQIRPWEAGFENETFSFLYMHTDNTGLLLERAVYWVGCQPTSAQLEIYNGRKGEVQFQELSVEYNGFPLMGEAINSQAYKILNWMNSESNKNMVTRNSWNYAYEGIGDTANGLSQSSLIGG